MGESQDTGQECVLFQLNLIENEDFLHCDILFQTFIPQISLL